MNKHVHYLFGKMALKHFTCLVVASFLYGMSEAQCFGRIRTIVPVVPNIEPCGSSIQDLTALITLAKAFDNNSGNSNCNKQSSGLNVDEVITKLVNALVFTSTQNSRQGHGGSGGSGSGKGGTSGSHQGLVGGLLTGLLGGGGGSGGGGGGGKKDQALIDLGVAKDGNLLGLGLGGTQVLDVGLGSVGEKPSSGGGSNGSGVVGGLLNSLL